MAEELNAASIRTLRPQGAFYLFPDFGPRADKLAARGVRTSGQLCDTLLQQTGVAILPGSEFGRPKHELTARLAYVDFDGAKVLSMLDGKADDFRIDEAFLSTHCPNVVTATKLICDWV